MTLIKAGRLIDVRAGRVLQNQGILIDGANDFGAIETWKYADIIAVSGDPLTTISELERVRFVMKGGEVSRNEIK